MKIVVDTNVIVSRLMSPAGTPARVLRLWREAAFDLLVSSAILDEYQRVVHYPSVRVRIWLSDDGLAQFLAGFRRFGLFVEPDPLPLVVQADPTDDMFLACAVSGGADYVVSGDRHLLQVREYRGIPILSPAVFLAVLERRPGGAAGAE